MKGMDVMRVNVRAKLLALAAVPIAFTVVLGLLAIVNLGSVGSLANTLYQGRLLPSAALGELDAGMKKTQLITVETILGAGSADEQAALDDDMATAFSDIDGALATVAGAGLSGDARDKLAAIEAAYPKYRTLITSARDRAKSGDPAGARAALADARTAYEPIDVAYDQLRTSVVDQSKGMADQVASTVWASEVMTVAMALVATLVALGLAVWLSRRIAKGVAQVRNAVTALGDGCATRLAEGMERLQRNDLTYAVTPDAPLIERYGTDEIGQLAEASNGLRTQLLASIDAYNAAREGLGATITEVQEAAQSVSGTSAHLMGAATQSGAATQQVATTITQVAGGTAEQARAASSTNAAVHELSAVIGDVGRGAAEAHRSVERSLDGVGRMQIAITASGQARAELAPANERAAEALAKVTAAIRESAAGMARIKGAVDESAVRVADLGAKGEQIGAIVETIDDIAEQTNLLALNAAIEAARAGEMGKGFAVVADEVRKLAERSGRATKEIAQLIAEVQRGTADAVRAMESGSAEVEQGLAEGRRGAQSADEIREATQVRDLGAARIYATLDDIASAARDVATASDDIARVVARTAQGASAMADASDSVTRSIESIAAVSEQNSAATEEVSAATEEMSAQAEEVSASATALAEMASRLDALVARFVLPDRARPVTARDRVPAGNARAERGRVDDWRRVA